MYDCSSISIRCFLHFILKPDVHNSRNVIMIYFNRQLVVVIYCISCFDHEPTHGVIIKCIFVHIGFPMINILWIYSKLHYAYIHEFHWHILNENTIYACIYSMFFMNDSDTGLQILLLISN